MTSIAAFTESSGRTQLFDRPLQKHLRGESTKEGALLDLLVPQNGVYWNRPEVSVNRGVILFDYHLVVVGGYNWTEVIPRETTAERIEKFNQKTRRKTNFRIQENQDPLLRFLRLSILKLLHFRDYSCFL